MGPGFESQPNHSKKASAKQVLFSFLNVLEQNLIGNKTHRIYKIITKKSLWNAPDTYGGVMKANMYSHF